MKSAPTSTTSVSDLSSYGLAAAAVAAMFGGTQNVEAVPVVYDNGGAGWSWSTVPTSGFHGQTAISLNLAGQVLTDGNIVANEQFAVEHKYGFNSPSSFGAAFGFIAASGIPGSASLPYFNVGPFGGGVTIGASNNTPSSYTALLASYSVFSSSASSSGPWTFGTRRYLGLQFKNGNDVHYGWASLTLDNPFQATLHAYAYESDPDVSITTPVPDTANSALLLAMGAGGVLALRRRREAVAAK